MRFDVVVVVAAAVVVVVTTTSNNIGDGGSIHIHRADVRHCVHIVRVEGRLGVIDSYLILDEFFDRFYRSTIENDAAAAADVDDIAAKAACSCSFPMIYIDLP